MHCVGGISRQIVGNKEPRGPGGKAVKGLIEFQLHAGSPVSYMERPFILEYKRQQYGAWFSKRGSVDLCFPSETLSLVYIDNGD